VGNAPAVDVMVDGELLLRYSRIEDENAIPVRFEPSSISFIRPGEEISEHDRHDLSFGNRCIVHLLDDFRECRRLNIHRVETDPSREPFTSARLKIFVYYRNNVGQWFESTYETHIGLQDIPDDDESAELRQIYVPRPKFHAGPLAEEEANRQISSRNGKRRLSGW
jgi:hypothetical protein